MATTSTNQIVTLGFFSSAFAPGEKGLALLGVTGHEELSRPYAFDLLLQRSGAHLTEDERLALVSSPCVIAMGAKHGDVVHGILTSIVHVDGVRDRVHWYRARLAPISALAALGRRSAVYQETTVPAMIAQVLGSYRMSQGKDFDVRITDEAKSPKHEYIVQYRESDWDFLSRWMEREGYFYWYTHRLEGTCLVVADANADTTPIDDPAVLSFRERNDLATSGEPTVWDLRHETNRVPAKVTLVDYNHRRPSEMLVHSAAVGEGGFGHVFQFGDHFKDGTVGAAWAKIRAEEILSRREVLTGSTDCSRFRVGHTFEVENHFVAENDGKYLLTRVEHRVGIDPAALDASDFSPQKLAEPAPYTARFTCIPANVQYRPARTTPWPRIDGVLNAHIDADSDGAFAQLDGEGRYKVKLPFDVGTKKGLASSRWIRMAQSYAGPGYGNHFPQHKGTEVLLSHVDGDPDRPIIVGAVPNTVTPGTVRDKNASQSVMQTASGIRVELEDSA